MSETPTAERSPVLALTQWLALVGLTFAALGFGMSWVAETLDIPSPVSVASAGAETAAGGVYPAPDFRLTALDGGLLGPPDFLGQVVLVELWATWCGPCRAQAQILEELYHEFTDVQFLAVDAGEDENTVRRFVESTPFPYPVLLDPTDSVSLRYRVTGLPTILIINRAGQVTYFETGLIPPATIRRELKAAGAGDVPGVTV